MNRSVGNYEPIKEQIQDLCKRNLKLVRQQKLAKQHKRGK